MKRIYILWLIIFASVLYSQTIPELNIVEDKRKSYPVDPRPFLERFNQVNGIDLTQPVQEDNVLRKTTAWNFKVGDKRSWYSSDFATNAFYQVPSTCRAVGNYCYIFVEDKLWDADKVDDNSVQKVLQAFESKTPANSSKGIYQTNIETFGNPPDIDGDPKIIILILDIKGGYSGSGGYVAGYFYAYHEYTTSQYTNSNKAEIYFLDGAQNNLNSADGLETAMSTTAHEFQHMIHWNYFRNKIEETFFDEAWSLIAEVINGYPLYSQNYYANESNHYLFDWRRDNATAVLNDYSRAARFALYLKEQFGVQIFKKYLENGITAASGLDYTLQKLGSSRRFTDILEDWFIANYLNNKNVNSRWGYSYPDLPKMKSIVYPNPNVTATKSVYKYGVQYITFNNGKNLNIMFNNLGNNIKIKAIKISNNFAAIEDISTTTDYSYPDFGTTYNEITFMIYFIDQSESKTGPFNFSYSADGIFENKPIEIAYDNKAPVGVFPWEIGDSVAVEFSGIAGTKLDSIKVALRTLSAMNGGIWYKSTTQGKYLGKKLAEFSVMGKYYVEGNYPPEWPNWVSVDLSDKNISTGSDFIVSFYIDGNYLGVSNPNNKYGPNRVMHTYQLSSNSVTYTTNGDTKGWYKFYVDKSSPQDSFVVYLIRAYVSYITSDNKEVIELLPRTYSLEQNYPNPFNPSTIISYQIPEMTNVQIKIYDALGREVRTLIDEIKPAGKYNIAWDGRDNFGNLISSGVYFYKIIAGNFVQTKKMILMK
ncbi:MAG: T9SS type A sorting domain-containing protein [Melioribacter sp.]|nr:T9SS type A sorting domain-containing protein [Melioribacter sp.]